MPKYKGYGKGKSKSSIRKKRGSIGKKKGGGKKVKSKSMQKLIKQSLGMK